MLYENLEALGLPHIHRGKVRDSYALPGHPDLMLVVASDRISIFDFVLSAEVADKGHILTALKVFWDRVLLIPEGIKTDTVAFGSHIDAYLPKWARGDWDLQCRAVVVRKLTMIPVECIIRGYLTGGGLSTYKKTAPDHMICGNKIEAGLRDGSQFANPIFTPTTKATEGHDEDITCQSVDEQYGKELGEMSWNIYRWAFKHATLRQVIIADTKFEFGRDARGRLVLGDEYLTPDSSRFWDEGDRNVAYLREMRTPKSHDKEWVRDWGRSVGVHKLDPKKPEDRAKVTSLAVPADVCDKTTELYHLIYERLTTPTGLNEDWPLEKFQQQIMRVAA